MKLSPQYLHWQSCRQCLKQTRMNFIHWHWQPFQSPGGQGSFLRGCGCQPCCRTGVALLASEGSQHRKEKIFSVFPHIQAHTEMKERKPEKELKPIGLSCAFYDIYIVIFNPCRHYKFATHVLNLKRNHLDQCHPISLSRPNTFQSKRQFDIQELPLGFMCTKLILLMLACGPFCNFLC